MTLDNDPVLLVKRAIETSGGLRCLSRQLDWHSGAISEVLARKVRLSPFRAIQCASVVGDQGDRWMFAILEQSAKTNVEREYWASRLQLSGATDK